MQTVLKKLHAMPGIIGSLLADDDGKLLANSFPALFDVCSLQTVCEDIKDGLTGMQDMTGGIKLIDLRYDHGRVIVKQMPTFVVLLLCEQTINFPLLMISLNVAVKNIEPLIGREIVKETTPIPAGVPQTMTMPVDGPHVVKADFSSRRLEKIVEASMAAGMI
jgi:predicted regulator of Ras-like GTPase activity (Roadblock/LC7/MglB family)